MRHPPGKPGAAKIPSSGPTPIPDKPRARETRGRLIDAARALFHEKGYAATSIAAIVARTGGSQATLYVHFNDKASLFEAVVTQDAERLAKRLSQTLVVSGQAPDVLAIAYALFDVATHPDTIGFLRAIISEQWQSPRIERLHRSALDALFASLDELLRRWVPTDPSDEGETLALTFFVLVLGDTQLAMLTGREGTSWLSDRRASIPKRLAALTSLHPALACDLPEGFQLPSSDREVSNEQHKR
ncbi:TetR/AcrR family transcriptional regulator [Sphingobium sp.]|uniref:TetR/AcrR family transcriptional regulator n=1 Tax=Sphingobium sp. TaxID=1912891 RepID=UPI000DB759E5|nr:TetR/AcrR family transcriptional regulator [Sphingobium sp.]PZU69324.1 MAG: hypothetical protein DI540_05100 [Sphingobium sp.]